MQLTQLNIKNFRNLKDIQINPVNGINLIFGNNAAGKTSLLEAIYYLSHVRSFRTQYVTDLILRQSPYLQLVANIKTADQQAIPLGIRRGRHKSEIRINKKAIKRVSEIASQFPVLAIHPDSYKLINGSPSQRRQYLDWGVFHVEQGFFDAWKRFKKSLAQRNAALKSKQKLTICQLWNSQINNSAHNIDDLRQQYFNKLAPYFYQLAKQFFTEDKVEIDYRRGWPVDINLITLLQDNLHRERMKGFTQYGPHRADIVIKVNGQSAQTCISRGQQKLLVALMRLAQAMQFSESMKKPCVLLYDDLPAELDSCHRNLILNVLSNMNIQLFITTIDKQQIDLSAWKVKKLFHVEHGKINTEIDLQY